MWIVRVALRRPYTFIVLALLILILSLVIILRTPTDIFPNIDIPVIAVAWQFTGLNPEELEGRLTTGFERMLTTTVDNIEHIESTTVNGQTIVKIFTAAECEPRHGQRTGDGHLPDSSATVADQHFAPVDHQLQRLKRADSPTHPLRTGPLRAAAQRPRFEFLTTPAHHSSRRLDSLSLLTKVWLQVPRTD